MADTAMLDVHVDSQEVEESQDIVDIGPEDIALETPVDDVFRAPSISSSFLFDGKSYTHHSPVPETISQDMRTECVLGVDEAGRGPVLGEQLDYFTICRNADVYL